MSTTAARLAALPLAMKLPCSCLCLPSARERMGITLEQIAQSTRIASYYLQAIEAEEFAKLPGGVYATSYIRQYARAIGYSETALLDRYHARSEEEPMSIVAVQQGTRVTTRLGEAMELFRGRLSAKPRTHHPA